MKGTVVTSLLIGFIIYQAFALYKSYTDADTITNVKIDIQGRQELRATSLNTPTSGGLLEVQYESKVLKKDCDVEIWVYAIGDSVFPLSNVHHPAWFVNAILESNPNLPFISSFKIPEATTPGIYTAIPTARYFCKDTTYTNSNDVEFSSFQFQVKTPQ